MTKNVIEVFQPTHQILVQHVPHSQLKDGIEYLS